MIGITISRAQVGFDLVSGGLDKDHQTVGGVALIDGVINDTPIGIRSSTNSQGSLHGSLVLNNLKLNNVPSAVAVADGTVVLAGGSNTVSSWGQGNVFTGTGTQGQFVQGEIAGAKKDGSLLDSAGRIFGRGHPQYADFDASQVLSARGAGAKGDGVTDDTAALQSLFNAAQGCKIAFLDAGVYYVTDTGGWTVYLLDLALTELK
jgi:glucan 1,3-beta-glucosidase